MQNKFPVIMILLFGFLLVNKENLHNEQKNVQEKNMKRGERTKRAEKNKKNTHTFRKTIRKGYKITSDEPIDPENLKINLNLGKQRG